MEWATKSITLMFKCHVQELDVLSKILVSRNREM